LRNNIFYFGNYQGIHTHAQGLHNTTVPTATAKQGGLGAIVELVSRRLSLQPKNGS
jgi:hypothetical protein